MKNEMIVIPHILQERFDEAYGQNQVIFFSAPCGTGKTATANILTRKYQTFPVDFAESGCLPEEIPDAYACVLVDNFQQCQSACEQQNVVACIKNNPKMHFVFLSRGVLPGCLMSWQTMGRLVCIHYDDLLLDKNAVRELFQKYGAAVTEEELQLIMRDTQGYAIAVSLLARRLAKGEAYTGEILGETERKLFHYLEESVYRRFEQSKRSLLLGLAPFEQFDAELARLVSGESHVGEILSQLVHETTMFMPGDAENYRFWPVFRKFLMWELSQDCTVEKQKEIYRRAGLYYELQDDYANALQCYKQCGDHSRISEILIKNGSTHPGTMHYYDMEQYYYALSKEEILRSPELMSAMSMLAALSSDMETSEQWYRELKDFTAKLDKKDADYKNAKSRLLFLDISLPQRGSGNLIDLINVAFQAMHNKNWTMPEFSVTSTLPSLMNGGKDFCAWSKMDDVLYVTMRKPAEAVLGKDGVALADCAICESKFEKGEDISERLLEIMTRMPDIRSKGTPDIEFAAMGLVIRQQTMHGKAASALSVLEGLRDSFAQKGQTRFFRNMDAMRCRLWLRLGMTEEAVVWLREQAPSYLPDYQVMFRYQYMTAAMVEIARGRAQEALPYVALFFPYCKTCDRTMDMIYIHLITAICRYRMQHDTWQTELAEALDGAQEYGFITPIAQFGAAVMPLLTDCHWKTRKKQKAREWFDKVLAATREQTLYYPDFLRPPVRMIDPLTPAEMQVLRLLCYNRTNQEIADVLGVKMPTIKTHVRNILQKLGVRRRTEVKDAARQLGLVE